MFVFHLIGSLSQHSWQVFVSVFLVVPCMIGILYLIFLQRLSIHLEVILCTLELILQLTEIFYVILFAFTACRPVTYG